MGQRGKKSVWVTFSYINMTATKKPQAYLEIQISNRNIEFGFLSSAEKCCAALLWCKNATSVQNTCI